MDRILVTGANGFVGRQLCRSLSQKGFWVKAAVRQTAIAPTEEMQYIPVGDIGPDTDWTEALHGVHLVVHLAGSAYQAGKLADSMAE
jgi:nucleoside-diphosphate-sugar epimerase